MTIAKLKAIVNAWPDKDEEGDDIEVWVRDHESSVIVPMSDETGVTPVDNWDGKEVSPGYLVLLPSIELDFPDVGDKQ